MQRCLAERLPGNVKRRDMKTQQQHNRRSLHWTQAGSWQPCELQNADAPSRGFWTHLQSHLR